MEILVARGLRAELQAASLLTGSKVVALAFHPRAPRARVRFGGRYPELPTIPGSGFDGQIWVKKFNRTQDDVRDIPLRPDGWTVKTVGERLDAPDPWAGMSRRARSLPKTKADA